MEMEEYYMGKEICVIFHCFTFWNGSEVRDTIDANIFKSITWHWHASYSHAPQFPTHHIPLYLNGCHPFQINDMVLVSLMSHLCAILTQPDIVIQVINEMTNQPSQLFSSLKYTPNTHTSKGNCSPDPLTTHWCLDVWCYIAWHRTLINTTILCLVACTFGFAPSYVSYVKRSLTEIVDAVRYFMY